MKRGLPWWSSSWNSMLSIQEARVQSLVRELRSLMLQQRPHAA